MNDKLVLITGASSGIGLATATALAMMGAHIVMLCRNDVKTEVLRSGIIKSTGNNAVDRVTIDLANLTSVRKAADEISSRYNTIDVLINNAGGYFGRKETTADGFEYTFGMNHLGHFLLTNLLLKKVNWSKNARIINLSSEAHRMGKINFEDLMATEHYRGFRAYCQAKLANILFTLALADRIKERGISVNAVHPGTVRTNFGNQAGKLFKSLIMLYKPFMRSPEKGAETVVYLAESPLVSDSTGKYYANKRLVSMNPIANDKNTVDQLWKISCELTGFVE